MSFATALLAAGPAAHGQTADARQPTLPDRLSAGARAQITALSDSLMAERLPAAALHDKAAEGMLKGADDARIVSAVRALAQRLRTARDVLGRQASDDELLAAASTLYAGVPASSITRLANTHRSRRSTAQSLTVSLSVVAELATARVPSEVALRAVEQLLSRGAADADLRSFRATVERGIRDGRAPHDATSEGVQRTLRGLDRVP